MYEAVDTLVSPVEINLHLLAGGGLVDLGPVAVEPDAADGPVVRQQFGNLRAHKIQVIRVHLPLLLGVGYGRVAGIVAAAPVQQGVVEIQGHPLPVAGIGEFLEDVAAEGAGVHYVIVGGGAVEHREPVVVAGGDGDVAGAGGLYLGYPPVRIEFGGIEAAGQLGVLLIGYLVDVHHPLSAGEHGIHSPVDEDAELVVAELLFCSSSFGGGNIALDALVYIAGCRRKSVQRHQGGYQKCKDHRLFAC